MVFNNNQQYLYDTCIGISSGECVFGLELKKSDPVINSRWLATADSMLKIYVDSENLFYDLVILTRNIIYRYLPLYGSICFYNESLN